MSSLYGRSSTESGAKVPESAVDHRLRATTGTVDSIKTAQPLVNVSPISLDVEQPAPRAGEERPSPPALPTHEVRCAWCSTLMSPGVQPVSHGICGPCAAAMRAKRVAVVELVRCARVVDETVGRRGLGAMNLALQAFPLSEVKA